MQKGPAKAIRHESSVLEVHVVKRRRDFTVDVAFTLNSDGALALFGASGAGKSTVLACVAGTERPDAGSVRLDGEVLFPPGRPLHLRGVGYMTQGANLFPHLSVAQNVRYSGRADAAWIEELRKTLGIDAVWNVSATKISAGQARRVALARMLAARPKYVLLDEPFAGLDRHVERELLGDLARWHARGMFALLVVDHRPEVLERITSRALIVEDGKVVQEGTWSELHAAPATPLCAALLAPL